MPLTRGIGVFEDVAQVGAAVLAAHLAVRALAHVRATRAVEASGVGVPPGVLELASCRVQRVRAGLAREVAGLREVGAEFPGAVRFCAALAKDVKFGCGELLAPLVVRQLVRIAVRPEQQDFRW